MNMVMIKQFNFFIAGVTLLNIKSFAKMMMITRKTLIPCTFPMGQLGQPWSAQATKIPSWKVVVPLFTEKKPSVPENLCDPQI